MPICVYDCINQIVDRKTFNYIFGYILCNVFYVEKFMLHSRLKAYNYA